MKVLYITLALCLVSALSASAGVQPALSPGVVGMAIQTTSSVIETASGEFVVIGAGDAPTVPWVQTTSLTASFSAPSEQVPTGTPVTLDASSSGGEIVEYAWDLNSDDDFDVTTSLPTYSTVFDESGEYSIQLRVTDALGHTAVSGVTAIEIMNRSPMAVFLTPDALTDADGVAFQDASRDADGSIVAWQWDFGDGVTSTAASPTHVYTQSGTYEVALTVTDNEGAVSATYVHSVTVVDAPPVAAFVLSASSVDVAEPVTVTDTSSDPSTNGRIVHVAWDFGDGTYLSSGPSSDGVYTHTYLTAGTYTITLYVIDNGGGLTSVQRVVHVL